ncbi:MULTISPECIES: hypothetical protein [unclassified Bradyrhizobium]|uniref:hypothetical protein n=1 Tax=unclassified Bradyrhizobium TaxID=2631580 RepID=UPI002915D556|nr:MULTISPECIES: hypothetical protein [unclassified Bradyrhizobium]
MTAFEARQRIKFLNQGPWIRRGRRAWREIGGPPAGSSIEVAMRQRQLRRLLRSHWDDEIYLEEGIVRDSFDEALTLYQLYELAVETGYIQLEDVRDRIYRELGALLWSDGARRYLRDYSYAAIVYLAQRVELDLGFKRIPELPPVRKSTQGRFASFLSQHALWYKDRELDGWIDFLDDYQVLNVSEETDKEVLWTFLTTSRRLSKEARLWRFVAGADRLLMQLAGLAESLAVEEKPSYGMFYAYWMAKLYGYDLKRKGFVRDPAQVDWPKAMLASQRIIDQLNEADRLRGELPEGIKPQDAMSQFARRDEVVRAFWDITRKQFESDPIQFA